MRVFIALAILAFVMVLATWHAEDRGPVPRADTTEDPALGAQKSAQPPGDARAQFAAPVRPSEKASIGSEETSDTLEYEARPQTHATAAVPAVLPMENLPREATPGERERAPNVRGLERRRVPSEAPSAQARIAGAGAATAPGNTSGPLLYIHVRSEAQRAHAERMIAPLARHGIRVSGIKVVRDGPAAADLRYFRPGERAEALSVMRALDNLGKPAHRLKYIAGFEAQAPLRQYELWLPPA